jgi:hypothetical protein
MEDFETNLGAIEGVVGELMELLPDEPTTELEAKVAELLGLVEQHMALLVAMDAEGDDAGEEVAADEVADTEDI